MSVLIKGMDTPQWWIEEVYEEYNDTVGNYHWTGTYSGKHIVILDEVKDERTV